jgi:hypothetical protein
MYSRNVIVLAVLALTALPALAQPQVGPQVYRPAVSPYLLLTNNNNGFLGSGINYYNQIQPLRQFRSNILGLQQQAANQQMSIEAFNPANFGPPTTGHGTTFLNTGGYYARIPGGYGLQQHVQGSQSQTRQGGQQSGRPSTGTGSGTGAGASTPSVSH